MRPEDYPYNHDATLRIWHHCRNTNDDEFSHAIDIDPLIRESWKRCRQHFQGNYHLLRHSTNPPDVHSLLEQHGDLISIATPYLEDIYQLTNNTAHVVFLTDNQGKILALEINPTVSRIYQKIGYGLGENWLEDHSGTNSIALSLITAMATQVVGAEHYLQIYHDYGNTAAPIHGNQGEIIGTVGICTLHHQTDASHLALMMATARAITNQIQSDLMLEQANQRFNQLNAIVESVADGVITWDNQWKVDHINSTACKILGIPQSALLGRSIDSIMDLAPNLRDAIVNQQEISDVEVMLQVGDRIVKCIISVRAIHHYQHSSSTAGIAMLRPLAQVRQFVNQQTSTQAVLTFDNFHTNSAAIRKLLRQAEVAARASAPVLLYGESGVGKTALAQAIHKASSRSTKPLILVNCSAIPHDMILSELLGVEAHGGENGRPSKFELADSGTLILDQIEHLSLEGQALLQQIIDTRHVFRLNSSRPTPVNVRVIATTDTNIDALVEAGSFSKQLYFRFSVFKLFIPPLRNRKEDIEYFVRRSLSRGNTQYEIENDALALLENYPWPGNVRELENVTERAMLHSEGNVIRFIDLPEDVRTMRSLSPQRVIPQTVLTLAETEREAIIRAGWACEGVISSMADILGINRSTLWRKMNEFGIKADDFK